jgi:hypothetical protein
MSYLEPLQSGGLSIFRPADRAVARVNGSARIGVAQAGGCQTVQEAQVDALSAVTQRALQGVAFISQVEQQLAQAVPLAATRLQGLADIGALGLGQVVMDTAQKLRRL